jgi:hypothetical protein
MHLGHREKMFTVHMRWGTPVTIIYSNISKPVHWLISKRFESSPEENNVDGTVKKIQLMFQLLN